MTRAAVRKEPPTFDEAKLELMVEPITVRASKKISGREMPLPLPVKNGESIQGKGWSKDDCRELGDFLVNSWSGGGMYVISFVDSQGVEMKWEPYWPPERHPEKTPPGMTNVAITAPATQPQLAAAPVQQVAPAPQPQVGHTSWLQTVPAQYVTPPQQVYPPQPPVFYPPQNGGGHYAPGGGPVFGGFQGTPLRASFRDEDRDDKLRAEREARLNLEADMKLQRQEAAHAAQLSALQQEIRRVAETAAARPHDDDRVRDMERQLQEERRSRELESRLAAMQQANQAQIQALQQASQQQMAALQTALAQLAAKPSGPDPLIMMLIELQKTAAGSQLEAAKVAADAQKEVARLQAESQREAARTAIGPREMLELATKMSPGTEAITSSVARVLELNHQAIEQALQLQSPGVHPALAMAGEAAQGALQVAQDYFKMKSQATDTQARAQVQTAAYQAQAAQAQLAGATVQAAAPQAAPAAAAPEAPDADGDEEMTPEEIQAEEQEAFGPAYEQVMRLRKGVESGALKPLQAAQALVQGINEAIKQKIAIPAFELWRKGEFLELVELLIPDAKPSFKDQMGSALVEIVQEFRAAEGQAKRNKGAQPEA